MANRDNRKNKHNRGGFKSIGSQVGGDLGGHLSKQGKTGGGTKKGGNFSFGDFGKFVGNFFTKPGYANTMGQVTGNLNQLKEPSAWKVKQFADKNIDITKMNKSFKVDIDTNRAIQGIENEKVRNWLNKYTPQSVKDLKINHQMYSPTKVMPGDKGYNPTGTGSIKLDPDTEKYLEWMAGANPQGKTISDYEKIYAKQIAGGTDLKTAMRFNPAETGNFYALIDDKEDKKQQTKQGDMALTKNQKAVQDIFGTHLGRKAATEGQDYWSKQLDAGGSIEDVIRGIQSGSEYKNRAAYKKANPNATEAQLDANISPGGGKLDPNAKIGNEAPTFAADNTWSSPLMTKGNNTWTDELTNIYKDLKIGGASETGKPHYNTAAGTNYGEYTVGKTHDSVGKPWSPGSGNTGTGNTGTGNTGTGTATGLTQADLDKWWASIDKSAWTGGGQQSSKWDDFTSFMSALGPMMGGGSGYGYPNMGYGGYAPGGVAAANPYGNMMNFMNAFKSIGGGGSGASSISSSSLTK